MQDLSIKTLLGTSSSATEDTPTVFSRNQFIISNGYKEMKFLKQVATLYTSRVSSTTFQAWGKTSPPRFSMEP